MHSLERTVDHGLDSSRAVTVRCHSIFPISWKPIMRKSEKKLIYNRNFKLFRVLPCRLVSNLHYRQYSLLWIRNTNWKQLNENNCFQTLCHATIDVCIDILQHIARILIDNTLGTSSKPFYGCIVPPLFHISILIKLSSTIIKTVRNFVSNHYTDSTII